MESVPGAIATGSLRIARIEMGVKSYPVAIAPGTDLQWETNDESLGNRRRSTTP